VVPRTQAHAIASAANFLGSHFVTAAPSGYGTSVHSERGAGTKFVLAPLAC